MRKRVHEAINGALVAPLSQYREREREREREADRQTDSQTES